MSSAQRNVHRCGPFHCVRHGTCRVHLQSIAGTYTGRYAQALSVPHAELDERGEVVPHGRPMPSTPPLALSYAVKLSGSNRARFWYLLLPRGASTSTRRATRACPVPFLSPHSGLRDVCTYHSGKVTPILGTLPLRLHATRCQLRGQDDVPGCYRGRKRPLSYLHGWMYSTWNNWAGLVTINKAAEMYCGDFTYKATDWYSTS